MEIFCSASLCLYFFSPQLLCQAGICDQHKPAEPMKMQPCVHHPPFPLLPTAFDSPPCGALPPRNSLGKVPLRELLEVISTHTSDFQQQLNYVFPMLTLTGTRGKFIIAFGSCTSQSKDSFQHTASLLFFYSIVKKNKNNYYCFETLS